MDTWINPELTARPPLTFSDSKLMSSKGKITKRGESATNVNDYYRTVIWENIFE